MSIADILKAEREARERADNKRAAQAFTPTGQQPAAQSASPYGDLYATVDPNLVPSNQPLKPVALPASVQRILGIAQAPLPASMRGASMPTQPTQTDTEIVDLSGVSTEGPRSDQISAAEYVRQRVGPRTEGLASLGIRAPSAARFVLPEDLTPQRQAAIDTYQAERQRVEQMQESDRLRRAREIEQETQEDFEAANKALEGYKPSKEGPYSNLSSKIFAGIAIALGEAARGFRGGQGRNVGLDLINQAIDREAKRQQDEYNRLRDKVNLSENAYARSMQALGNAETAFANTKRALMDQARVTMDVALDSVGASQQAENLRAQIKNQEAQANAQFQQSIFNARVSQKAATGETTRRLSAGKISESGKLVGELKAARALLKQSETDNSVTDKLMRKFISNPTDTTLGALTEAGLTSASPRIQALKDFYTKINAVAFGQASQGQSASSISDKDVKVFRDLLAEPNTTVERLESYLEYLQNKASAALVYNSAIVEGADFDRANQIAEEYMKDQFGYVMTADGDYVPPGYNEKEWSELEYEGR
tara:strand:- start:16479 stop:18095 length:1617 start_codon:yes stop_codon:yes gene_type:complete